MSGSVGRGREALVCPKHMVFGPCGGVRAGGACEVAEDPCVFLGRAPLRSEIGAALRDRTAVPS